MENFVKCLRCFAGFLICLEFWIMPGYVMFVIVSDEIIFCRQIIYCDCLISDILEANNVCSHDSVAIIVLEKCQCGSKVCDSLNWNSFLICFIFKCFQRLIMLFLVTYNFEQSLFLGTFFLGILEMLLHFQIHIFFTSV